MNRQSLTGLIAWIALALIVALGSGCATAPRDTGVRIWNPLTWFSRAEASAADRAEQRLGAARADRSDAREDVLRAAQRAAHEAEIALLSAPPSRPVEVASEAAGHATANLDQALGALSAEALAAIREQVEALVSDNAALRAEGERLRAEQRARDYDSAAKLAAADKRAAAAEAVAEAARHDLRQAYDRESALANELRTQRWLSGLATAASVAGVLFGLAMRSNFLGVAKGAGEMLGTLRARYGVRDEDVVALTGLLDAPTTPSAQQRIAAVAADTVKTLLAESAAKP